MAFHVGQKVVCVDDSPNPAYGPTPLTINAIYTVHHVVPCPNETPGLLITEVKSDAPYGFRCERFRPVIERKTNIAIFTAMLTPNRVNA